MREREPFWGSFLIFGTGVTFAAFLWERIQDHPTDTSRCILDVLGFGWMAISISSSIYRDRIAARTTTPEANS